MRRVPPARGEWPSRRVTTAAAKTSLTGMSGATSTTTVTPAAVEATISDALTRFGVEATDITREATFAHLDVDSLDLAEIGQRIDETYGVELRSEDLRAVRTVGDAIDLVVSRAG